MTMVAAGTFLAQAIATGLVGRIATHDRAAASGMYLAAYFAGGLVGSAVLGQAYQQLRLDRMRRRHRRRAGRRYRPWAASASCGIATTASGVCLGPWWA